MTEKLNWKELCYISFMIVNEHRKLKDFENYWGSHSNITNENLIFDFVLKKGIVDQDWFDNRLKHTSIERIDDLYKVIVNEEHNMLDNLNNLITKK